MLTLVVLGFALIALCEMGVDCKISAYMSVVGLLLLALDQRIVDTKRSWWDFVVSNEPRTLVPLERDFPYMYEFLAFTGCEWDYDYPDISTALSTEFQQRGYDVIRIREELRRIIDNIDPYFEDIGKALNTWFDDETEMKEILTQAILNFPLPVDGVESN